MFHPYRDGYSVLPMLTKVGYDQVFLPTPDLGWYLTRKRIVGKSRRTNFAHRPHQATLDAAAVDARLADLARNEDLSRYIL